MINFDSRLLSLQVLTTSINLINCFMDATWRFYVELQDYKLKPKSRSIFLLKSIWTTSIAIRQTRRNFILACKLKVNNYNGFFAVFSGTLWRISTFRSIHGMRSVNLGVINSLYNFWQLIVKVLTKSFALTKEKSDI